jgi:ATP-binding cassette subfamily B protein
MTALENFIWTTDRLYALVQTVAREAGLSLANVALPQVQIDVEQCDHSVKRAARFAEVEAHRTSISYAHFEDELRALAPCVLRVDGESSIGFVGVRRVRGRRAELLLPGGRSTWQQIGDLRRLICDGMEKPYIEFVSAVSRSIGVRPSKRSNIARAMLKRFLENEKIGGVWILRSYSGQGLLAQVRAAGLLSRVAGVLVLYVLQSAIMVFSWFLVGRGALEGSLETGVLVAWALLLVTTTVLGACSSWWQGLMMLGVNGLYKKKILHGATRLDSGVIRTLGTGALLGRVIETQSLDALVISAGFSSVIAFVDLLVAIVVFWMIPGSCLLSVLYVLWLVGTLVFGLTIYRRQQSWTMARISMTNQIVEGLLGRRTRIAQECMGKWHDREDRELETYYEESKYLDRLQTSYGVIVYRGWLCVAFIGLLPTVLTGGDVGALAAMLGAIMMSFKALGSFSGSISAITSMAISWGQAKLLYQASASSESLGLPEIIEMEKRGASNSRPSGEVVLEATGLRFNHEGRDDLILNEASLVVRSGDRVLLEGESGCGKSTLASLLCGLRRPVGGVILLRGFDITTLGDQEWARRIAYAPQFKENYLFSGTLSFNLLMGRRWPAASDDLQLAEDICRELGLGPLIDRMPDGMHTVVGETGWKLSHGERSRVFLARTLLQDADVVILDESFGALDPQTMRMSMESVFRRAPALVAIAHP